MSLMLWQDAAKNCTYKKGDVLTLHGVKVVHFGNSRNLSAISGTSILLNDDSVKVSKVKEYVIQKMSVKSESSDADST